MGGGGVVIGTCGMVGGVCSDTATAEPSSPLPNLSGSSSLKIKPLQMISREQMNHESMIFNGGFLFAATTVLRFIIGWIAPAHPFSAPLFVPPSSSSSFWCPSYTDSTLQRTVDSDQVTSRTLNLCQSQRTSVTLTSGWSCCSLRRTAGLSVRKGSWCVVQGEPTGLESRTAAPPRPRPRGPLTPPAQTGSCAVCHYSEGGHAEANNKKHFFF